MADTAAALQLTRRQTAGSVTARGLLFTVLGEFVLPGGGSAWTAAVIDVLGQVGIEEKAARQALARTAADGWLTAERSGRRTRWRLTGSAEHLLTDGAARIYGFTGVRRHWDGRWLLVLARAPEADRPARHLLRTRMAWAGFGSPAPGVWISPGSDQAGAAQRVLADAGLLDGAHIFTAEHQAGGELASMARAAWDLAGIERRYEQFISEFAGPPAAADPLARLTGLVHAWRRFPWIDPVLPAALLPDGWSGSRAAGLFGQRHAEWSPAAVARWQLINSQA